MARPRAYLGNGRHNAEKVGQVKDRRREAKDGLLLEQFLRKVNVARNVLELGGVDANHEVHGTAGHDRVEAGDALELVADGARVALGSGGGDGEETGRKGGRGGRAGRGGRVGRGACAGQGGHVRNQRTKEAGAEQNGQPKRRPTSRCCRTS